MRDSRDEETQLLLFYLFTFREVDAFWCPVTPSRWLSAGLVVQQQLGHVAGQHQLLQGMKSSLHSVRSQIHHMEPNEGAEPGQIQLFNSLF